MFGEAGKERESQVLFPLLSQVWAVAVDDLSDEIEEVKDSVGLLLMSDEQSFWEGD